MNVNDIIIQSEAYQLLLQKIDLLYEAINSKAVTKDLENLYTVKETAKKLRISEKTVRNYIEVGKIKAIDYNAGTPLRGNYRIKESEIKKQYK